MEYSLEKGLELIESIKNEKIKREAISDVCAILIDAELLDKAMELLQKNDNIYKSWVYYKLGKKYIERLEIEKAQDIAKKLKDVERIWMYMDMAKALFNNNMYDEAIKLVDEIEDPIWEAYSLIDFAKVALKRDNIRATQNICTIIENKLRLIDKTPYNINNVEFEKSGIMYEIARIYRKINNEKKAEYYYKESLKVLENLLNQIDKDEINGIYGNIAKIRYELGFKEDAYKFIKENKYKKDAVFKDFLELFEILIERDPVIEEIISDDKLLLINYLKVLMYNQYQEYGKIHNDLLNFLSKIEYNNFSSRYLRDITDIAKILKKAGFEREYREIIKSIEQSILKENSGFGEYFLLTDMGKKVGDFEKVNEWAEKACDYLQNYINDSVLKFKKMLEISNIYLEIGYYNFSMKILEQIYANINELESIPSKDRDLIIKNLSLNIIKLGLNTKIFHNNYLPNSFNNLKPLSS